MPGDPEECRARSRLCAELAAAGTNPCAKAAYLDLARQWMQLGEIVKAKPAVAVGSYPFFDPQHGPNTNVVLRARDAHKLAPAKRAVEKGAGASAVGKIKLNFALSRRKQGFESPRERHVICSFLYFQNLSGLFV